MPLQGLPRIRILMNIKCIAMMIMGIIEKAVRQVWPANSNGEVERTNFMLMGDGNQSRGLNLREYLNKVRNTSWIQACTKTQC